MHAKMVKKPQLADGARVLDVGCGMGTAAQDLARATHAEVSASTPAEP